LINARSRLGLIVMNSLKKILVRGSHDISPNTVGLRYAIGSLNSTLLFANPRLNVNITFAAMIPLSSRDAAIREVLFHPHME
jgi:hypothetical protein